MSQAIDTSDVIYHAPSDEKWLVAFVANGEVCCCGWPLSYAALADCTLVEKATPEERNTLLEQLAAVSADDPRKRYAVHRLANEARDSLEAP